MSLRLHLALVLTLFVFVTGTVAFVASHNMSLDQHGQFESKHTEMRREQAENNLTQYAVYRDNYILEPRGSSFLSDSREKYLPNSLQVNAYNVFGFGVKPGSINPYLQSFQELNWAFIVSLIMGFIVLLLTFDTISGEKQSRTLALLFANPVSRASVLFGKYISTILSALFILAPGMCLSSIILILSGSVAFTGITLFEIAGFMAASVVYISCVAAFGLLASVLSKTPNVSLLFSLVFWIVFVAIIPNSALFWSQTLFPIDSPEKVNATVSAARQEINDSAPKGSWSSSRNNPFYPRHELRANNQTNLMNSEKRIRDAWYNDMFLQLDRTRYVTLLSPVSLFEYMCEAIVDGGYVRFRKNWDDMRKYQPQFLTYFKDKDAADADSPHWYNPYENYSTTRKAVNFDELPRYSEIRMPISERLASAMMYLTIIIVYSVVIFMTSFMLFIRYDVR